MKPMQTYKVSEEAKVRNWCNQVPHLPQETTYESDKNIINSSKTFYKLNMFVPKKMCEYDQEMSQS